MKIILINVSGQKVQINDLGLALDISEQREIYTSSDEYEYSFTEIFSSRDLYNLIETGDIIINNGNENLSLQDSLDAVSKVSLEDIEDNIFEEGHTEITRTEGYITTMILWKDESKAVKIKECIFQRDTDNFVTGYVLKQYKDGNLKDTITYTISRDSSLFINNITGVKT